MELTWLKTAAAAATTLGVIGGSAIALDIRHVPATNFEQHLKAEESRYVLELKKEIRELQKQVREGNPYAEDYLADLIDALCEIRPDDKLCQ